MDVFLYASGAVGLTHSEKIQLNLMGMSTHVKCDGWRMKKFH